MAVQRLFLMVMWALLPCTAAAQNMVTAQVTQVDSLNAHFVVEIDAGTRESLLQGMEVTLLRETEPIVHPLTEAVLGVAQEPVGIGRITAAQEETATAQLIRVYSAPLSGDLVEYVRSVTVEPQAPSRPSPAVSSVVDSLRARMGHLEKEVAFRRRVDEQQASYPVFAREVWDELHSIRSHLVSIDERMLELEQRQRQDRGLLERVETAEYAFGETRQFTIRYDADTNVYLRVAGKTLFIDVQRDTLHLEATQPDLPDLPPERELSADSLVDQESEGTDWSFLTSPQVQVMSLGLIAVMGLILYVLMRRRDRDLMEDLDVEDPEDLDEESLEEEGEEW